jgi:hypothetical protein
MQSTQKELLSLLENGSLKYDVVCQRLKASRVLGFGLEPEEVISSAVLKGLVFVHPDGKETWVHKAEPFKKLSFERTQEILSFKEGQQIDVKWPDGSITVEHIRTKGGPHMLGIDIVCRGFQTWVQLPGAELAVRVSV